MIRIIGANIAKDEIKPIIELKVIANSFSRDKIFRPFSHYNINERNGGVVPVLSVSAKIQ